MRYTNFQPTPVFSYDPATGHSDRRQRHGTKLISTGDIVQLSHQNEAITDRSLLKNRDKRVTIHGMKPSVTANTSQRRLLTSNPRWLLRRATPSQQGHADTAVQDQNEHQTAHL